MSVRVCVCMCVCVVCACVCVCTCACMAIQYSYPNSATTVPYIDMMGSIPNKIASSAIDEISPII